MTRTLRDYQAEAVDLIRADWAAGITRTAAVLATGLGKSTVLGKIATDHARDGGRVLVLCHLAEALDQIAATCHDLAPDVAVGRVQAGRNESRRPITTAMIQTVGHEQRRARLPRPSLVIVDEAHHAVSPRYMEVLRWAGSFDGVPTLGVTATMVRGDRLGLGDVWQNVPVKRGIEWAVNHGRNGPVRPGEVGWLVRPHGRVVVADHVKLDTAKVSRGDYQDGELGAMVSQDTDQIVRAWIEHAADRITVAFTPNVASANDLRDEFERAGVKAELVVGSTRRDERQAVYARLASGVTRVLVSVMVTVEAWDCPPVSCILMARPTKLVGLYTQAIGRGLRPSPGKADCLVLDVVGASRTQRLVTLIDLSPTAEINRDEIEALPCEVCGGWLKHELPDLDQCSCPVEDEGGGRDPDGGRVRLRGPARYAEVDLLGLAPEGAEVRWLATRAGVPFCSAGEGAERRYGVLWDEGGGRWSGGHCAARGAQDGVWLAEHVALDVARAAVQAWAVDAGHRPAPPWWRARQAPSEAQVRLARRMGVVDPEGYTKGALSDELDVRSASRRLDVVR